ncbi:MAG: N-acetylmuramoyl-L-alanine amidase [Gemmatimonadota bacterium]
MNGSGGGRGRALAAAAAALAAAACASSGAGPRDARRPGAGAGALPPIPAVRGPLAIRVAYPDSGDRITARDSNFVFGTVGTGDASLIIDGFLVPVEPNGAFLAWLPVPPAENGDTATYLLVARRGEEMDTLRHPVLLPPAPAAGPTGTVWLDSAGLVPPGPRWALPDEDLDVGGRGEPGLTAWLEAGERRIGLAEIEPGAYRVRLSAAELYGATCSAEGSCSFGEEADSLSLGLVATDGRDTARIGFLYSLRVLDPRALPVAELREEADPVNGTNGVVVGRPLPDGPYRWRFPTGTVAAVSGRVADRLRIRLAPGLDAWVVARDARWLPAGTPEPESRIGDLGFELRSERILLRVPLQTRLPAQIEETDATTLRLTLFGGLGNTNRIAHGAGGRDVRDVRWEQLPGRRYRLTIRLAEPVWGYRMSWEVSGQAAPALRLEIRRAPPIDRARPLRGRRIALDPGHPGGGAHGPTGLYEADANLAVARAAARILADAGAVPILVRDDTLALGLYQRTTIAEDAGAELFVSIHNNAFPDGVRPFGREGSSTYYYHLHSRALAEAVQDGLVRRLGLRDLGIFWGDLAVARMSWMPSVLAEGTFVMMPAHEAALRDPAFQDAYARGVVDGIRRFLAARAADPDGAPARGRP